MTKMGVMLTRFRVPKENGNSPHPMGFPQHPYWAFDQDDAFGFYVIVTYSDNNDMQYIVDNWPNAEGVDVLERTNDYEFSGSLQKPAWWF